MPTLVADTTTLVQAERELAKVDFNANVRTVASGTTALGAAAPHTAQTMPGTSNG
jgi:hypothetical protein